MEVIPALSKDGWTLTSLKKADYLMSHFFLSDYSQSYLYSGKISSLPYIIQSTKDNINDTINLLESTLNSYFIRYFNNVVVEAREVPSDSSNTEIEIYVQFDDKDGNTNTLAKLIKITDSKIKEIININNG